ncbi:MAG: XRE family transcriptional regulator [Salinivirgaceae bacterium]|nr:XRE family transcriptional regulator [Salinivirgaceae bacterium]
MAVHIGRIIEEELKRQKRTKAWLAREVNCERTNIYNVLKSADINTSMLMRISKALNKNLFAYYSREFQKRRGKASE